MAGLARQDVAQPAVEQRAHAVGRARLGDLIGGGALADPPLQLGVHGEHFDDAEPAPIAGHGALGTADRAEQLGARPE